MKYHMWRVVALVAALAMLAGALPAMPRAEAVSPDIVISQVYGGGGNSGATYTNDFIELFNRGSLPVSVTGWSVQYASATGTSWQQTTLNGTLQPGQYYLVQEAAGTGGTTPLPTPDASGNIAMSGTNGKVALVNTTAALSGSGCPFDASVVDFVGYGTANCAEGSATPALSNTTADLRANDGCTDSDNNSADFATGAPSPRNSASPVHLCTGPTDPSGTGAANPDPVAAGSGTLLTVAVTPGTNPASTGLTVSCDLTAIGGAGSQSLFDDGTNGDVTAGDLTFSYQATVAGGTSAGAKSLACTINDAEGRSGSASIALTVQEPGGVATLVINEIDYDQPSTDASEFVEIRNNGPDSANLGEYTLELVNGNGGGATVYQTIALPAVTLAANDYFVVCGDAANVPNCDLDMTPDTNLVQNGAPDAVGLRHNGALVDAVSYEGNTGAPYTEGSGVGLEDDSSYVGAGISRCPDGVDSDQNNVDFSLRAITPGAANACLPAVVINEIDYDQPSTDTAEFVEIRNNDLFSYDLGSFTLELVNGNGGGAAIYATIALNSVILAPGDYYVVCANATTVANCDQDVTPDTNLIQNGAPDAVGLRYNGALIDAVSYEGDTGAPYTEGSGAGLVDDGSSATQGISRCPDGVDTNVNNVDFSLRDITPGAANNCVDDVPPTVASTSPANGTLDASINTNIVINFSEDVTVSGSWFDITCTSSGVHSAAVSGGPASYTLDPDVSFTNGESCTVTVFAANVTDLDGTPDNMAADYSFSFTAIDVCVLPYTPIYDIQGSGLTAAITGPVVTQGVVVGDYEGPSPTLRGFYIEDAAGDGNPATSDGIFVFNFDNNNVNLGDVVRVTGSAGEFQDQTQISSVTAIANCGAGVVTPVDVTLPVPSATYLEQYEGMLVRFPQTLYVTEHFQLGRFGQVVLSGNARLQQPTNVVLPGAAALALQAANDLNRIILDDATQDQNPDPIIFARGGLPLSASNTLRGGDTATNIVGVMTYTWAGNAASGNAYRLRPINAQNGYVDFQPSNPRPGSAPTVGGNVKVVGMNLLNFFNTFGAGACGNGLTGGATDCRGADDAFEFGRQWPKTVAAILKVDADVIGVNELENDGYGPASSLQFLVDQLNAATAPGTYAFIDVDAATGQVDAMGNDAIRVALLYKPASVTPIGQTAALNSVAFINGGDSGPRNRASLAQAFQENSSGGVFIVNVNHLKSKGSACDAPDAGDGQGNCNTARRNAVSELLAWFATDPTGTGDADILMVGDYNSYAMEDPIRDLQSGGFTNLVSSLLGPDAYSYVFDGQWGYLDQALASPSLTAQVTGVGDYHINADEPSVLDYNDDFKSLGQIISLYAADEFRVSDHDPVITGLQVCDEIAPTLSVSLTPNVLWPPNHKYVAVTATVVANDNFDPNPTVTLVSYTSNEPDDGLGDGDKPNDIVVVDDTHFQLRAERSGLGDGRVYTITYQVTDACGNSTTASATVTVPKSQKP